MRRPNKKSITMTRWMTYLSCKDPETPVTCGDLLTFWELIQKEMIETGGVDISVISHLASKGR